MDSSCIWKKRRCWIYTVSKRSWMIILPNTRRTHAKIYTKHTIITKIKWVWSGNTTITHCRPTHGPVRKRNRTLAATRHQEDIQRKASPLFSIKTTARPERTQIKHHMSNFNGHLLFQADRLSCSYLNPPGGTNFTLPVLILSLSGRRSNHSYWRFIH